MKVTLELCPRTYVGPDDCTEMVVETRLADGPFVPTGGSTYVVLSFGGEEYCFASLADVVMLGRMIEAHLELGRAEERMP